MPGETWVEIVKANVQAHGRSWSASTPIFRIGCGRWCPIRSFLLPDLGHKADPATLCALRGGQPGDLLVPGLAWRGPLRVEDRTLLLDEYRLRIKERLQHFKAIIAAPVTLSKVG